MIDWQTCASDIESDFMTDLKTLMQIPSVYDESTVSNDAPFGEAIRQALDAFLHLAKRDGFATIDVDHKAGCIRYGSGQSIVGALGHVDVMPAGGQWLLPPFDLTEKDEKLFGRGILDDKGPLLACYYGLKILRDLNLPIKNEIHLIIGTDEENQWRCMDRYFKTEPIPVAGFSPDSVFPVVHAEKGILHVDLAFDPLPGGDTALHSFYAGESYNSVPDQAVAEIELSPSATWQLKPTGAAMPFEHEAEGMRHRFVQTGRSAHAMNPGLGTNAATHAALALSPMFRQSNAADFVAFLADIAHEDFFGKKLGLTTCDEEMGDLSVNVGKVRWSAEAGGVISLDIRYPRNTDADTIMAKLQALPQTFTCTKKIGDGIHALPHYVPKNAPFVQTLTNIYHAHTGLDPTPLALGGVTYAKTFENCVAYGPLFPGREETAHCPDEYLYKEDLLKSIAIYGQALYELANLDFTASI